MEWSSRPRCALTCSASSCWRSTPTSPCHPEDAAGSEPRRIEAGRQASAGSENGSPPNPELQGGGLTEAALRLEAGAAELAAARASGCRNPRRADDRGTLPPPASPSHCVRDRIQQRRCDGVGSVARGDEHRTRRRPDRRRRPLGHRRRLPPAATSCPGKTLRDPRGARRDRRHLGPVPLSRASARTPTCSRSATRSGRGTRPRRSPTAPSILDYIRETAREYGIDAQIRFGHRVVARRVVERRRALDGGRSSAPTPARPCAMTCGFLFGCTGYYRYDEGYTPDFAGTERFARRDRPPAALARGPRLRRQARRRDRQRRDRGDARARRWPRRAAHVTMLQRSPTYIVSLPAQRPARRLRCARGCRAKLAYPIVRWKNVAAAARSSTSSAGAARASSKALLRTRRRAPAAAGLRRRHPLQAALRPLGPAPLPGARRRPVRGDQRRRGVDRHRRDRDASPSAGSGSSRARSSRPTSIVTATGLNLLALGGIADRRRRRARSTSPRPSATRA